MKIVMKRLGLLVRLGIAATALLLMQPALATGTDPGVSVSNTALVDYDVGGVGQPQLSAGPVAFLVDRRVDFTVTRMGTALTPTNLSDSDGFLDFYVTNLSNGDLDFNLLFTQLADGGPDIYGPGTGDTTIPAEDMGNVRIRVSSGLDPVGFPGTGPAPALGDGTFIDNLPEDRSIRVRIYADTPAALANGEISGLSLDATAADPVTTVNLAETPGADDPTLVENVFADTGNDNAESDVDGFIIQAATLAVTKTAAVVGGGKALPDAFIEYTIAIDNTGPVDATDIKIADVIQIADVVFDDDAYGIGNSVEINDESSTTYCLADLPDSPVDGCTYDIATGTLTVDPTATIDVKAAPGPGDNVTVKFRVQIK